MRLHLLKLEVFGTPLKTFPPAGATFNECPRRTVIHILLFELRVNTLILYSLLGRRRRELVESDGCISGPERVRSGQQAERR